MKQIMKPLKLTREEKIEIHDWWFSLPEEERGYWNGIEKYSIPSVSTFEAIEIFGVAAKAVLQEKLRDLSETEEKFQDLLEAKIAAAKRSFIYPDEFTNWFLTRIVSLRTANRLVKIKKEKRNIDRALLLLTKEPNKDWERKVETARQVPIEAFYRGKLRKVDRRLTGLCPFHQDTHPSFSIYTKDNSWYCFGCQRGGDAIDFIMQLEGLDFKSAVRRLA